ncbi:tetratricopeptide repeat protein [Pseudanabaena sp. Chao 1811]|uniref:tetratricopeptide repeat protein n=1 Tax=Pseudanabaena sp. Chao 1811 TaxID=2963092 RepID=UPI0022F3ED82|nr:tetratricopeptide repeat protein [Pseudanabaena sp. Chao 1811]
MEWREFLTQLADENIRNLKDLNSNAPTEATVRKTFIESFPEHHGVADNPFKGDKTKEAQQTLVYKCFEKVCPDLQDKRKGKWQILRDWLNDEFSSLSSHQKKDQVRANEPLPSIPVWHGREELLTQLQELLKESALRVLVLLGQGGIGKTSLAIKLMEKIKPQYQQVFYFRVREGTSFDDLANLILGDLQANFPKVENKIYGILQCLEKERCLLVLDNLEEILQPACEDNGSGNAVSQPRKSRLEPVGDLLNALVYGRHNSHVLLTSREMPYDLAERRSDGEIDPLLVRVERITGVSQSNSVQILKDLKLPDSETDLAWVAEQVDGHVLLLKLLVGASQGRRGYLRQNPQLVTKKAEPILRAQLGRLSEAAKDLLVRMCVLRVGIDVHGLTFLRLYTDDWENDERFEMAVITEEPVKLTFEELEETELLIGQLVAASLVQSRYDETRYRDFYDLHPVIVQFLQREYADKIPELMGSVYKFYCTGKNLDNPKTLEDLRPVLEAQYFAFQIGNYDEAKSLIYQIEDYLEFWGYWSLLLELYEQVLPYLKKSSQPYILQRIGSRHRAWGNWHEAEKYYQDGLSIAKELDDQSLIAGLTGNLGGIERNRGNWDAAESLFRQCLEVEEELGDRAGMATSWGALGGIERNRGNWDAAESLFRQSLQLSTELGDRVGMATSWGALGDIEHNRGNWDAAESLFRQCLEVEEELGDRAGMATSWGALGGIERNRGNWDAAESLFRQSLQLSTELGDRVGMATSWGALGDIEHNRGNWDAAESLYRQCLEFEEELGDRAGMASSWGLLGDIERNRGNWDAAESLYRQSLQLRTELGDREGMARSIGSLGEVELGRENLDLAETLLNDALQRFTELGNLQYMAECNFRLAQVWQKREDLTFAQKYYDKAKTIYQQLGAVKEIERIEKEWQL